MWIDTSKIEPVFVISLAFSQIQGQNCLTVNSVQVIQGHRPADRLLWNSVQAFHSDFTEQKTALGSWNPCCFSSYVLHTHLWTFCGQYSARFFCLFKNNGKIVIWPVQIKNNYVNVTDRLSPSNLSHYPWATGWWSALGEIFRILHVKMVHIFVRQDMGIRFENPMMGIPFWIVWIIFW